MTQKRRIDPLWWVGLGFIAIAAAMLGTELGRPVSEITATSITPENTIVVYKSPICGCCSKWVENLRHAGFLVETHDDPEMSHVRSRLGVPEVLSSCHTAVVNGYVIEGHVPADDIKKLLAEKPKAKGLAVPGMPAGSPGMEMGSRVDSYDVLLMVDGKTPSVFSHHGSISNSSSKKSPSAGADLDQAKNPREPS